MKQKNLFQIAIILLVFQMTALMLNGQTLPQNRSVNWKIAGLKDTSTAGFLEINVISFGLIGNGSTPNDTALSSILNTISGSGTILNFPEGDFLFHHSITLPPNIIIRGSGADQTTFTLDLNGTGNSLNIHGTSSNQDTIGLSEGAFLDSTSIVVSNSSGFASGNWIQLIQIDTDLVTSSWAKNTVGQIVQITTIEGNRLNLSSPLRISYPITRLPYIRKIEPIQNVGIECLKINRIDSTAPEQASNINYLYAVNCWVNAVEFSNTTFAHIDASVSSNLLISKCYFHHAFHYGDNGRGYGVVLNATTNECRVQDNIFDHLRHSMILQSGANGNVFGYNFSINPIWESSSPFLPTNSAGDMVLHGNYPYANLFEGNVCQNIVIDDSHGPNGPFNTFFRNKADGFGIFFSASNSPNQNFIGNEITNNTSPYNLVNYTIQGTGHFLYGNNNKGTIVPTGTTILPDSTLGYNSRPDFMPLWLWNSIGTPHVFGAGSNAAKERYIDNAIFSNSCGNTTVTIRPNPNQEICVYPNPMNTNLTISSNQPIKTITIYNAIGQLFSNTENNQNEITIAVSSWPEGFYCAVITSLNGETRLYKLLKIK